MNSEPIGSLETEIDLSTIPHPTITICVTQVSKFKTYRNLFLVFLISGLWHGAAMTFIIWGGIHGVIIVFEKALTKQRKDIATVFGLDKATISRKLFCFRFQH